MQLHHMNIQQHQQQQELIQQLQLMQRQYFIHQGFVKPLHVDFPRQAHVLMPSIRSTPPRGPVIEGEGTSTELNWPATGSSKPSEKDFQSIYNQNFQMDKLKSQQKQQQMDDIRKNIEDDGGTEEEQRNILSSNLNKNDNENESNEESLNGDEEEEDILDKHKQNERKRQKQQRIKTILQIPKEEMDTDHDQAVDELQSNFELESQKDGTDQKSNEELSESDDILKNSHKGQNSSPISSPTLEHQQQTQTRLEVGSTKSTSTYHHHQSILYEEMEASYTTQHTLQRKQQLQPQHNISSSLSHIYFPNELNFHLQQQQQQQLQDTTGEISSSGLGHTNLNNLFLNALNESSSLPLNDSDEEQKSKLYYHPLYSQGICRWPGCELVLDNISTFVKHINSEHCLDNRSTAQARVQMQVVSQLELHLQKERDRLQAMMYHLYLTKQMEPAFKDDEYKSSLSPSNDTSSNMSQNLPINFSTSLGNSSMPVVRKRISDRNSLAVANGLPYMLERAGLDVQQEIQRNREFYKNTDVRPPFTYASLIRQSIIESPDKQLTLNEIYNWFQNTFCYFRRNAATWKNAIRTNLSLHKCFVRYEDDFGSFWMVDDSEFVKRRHLSRGRPRGCGPSSASPTTSSTITTTATAASDSPSTAITTVTAGRTSNISSIEYDGCNNKGNHSYINNRRMSKIITSSTKKLKNNHNNSVGDDLDGIDICVSSQRNLNTFNHNNNTSNNNQSNKRKQQHKLGFNLVENVNIIPNNNKDMLQNQQQIMSDHGSSIGGHCGFYDTATANLNAIEGFSNYNFSISQNLSQEKNVQNAAMYNNTNYSSGLQNIWAYAPALLDEAPGYSPFSLQQNANSFLKHATTTINTNANDKNIFHTPLEDLCNIMQDNIRDVPTLQQQPQHITNDSKRNSSTTSFKYSRGKIVLNNYEQNCRNMASFKFENQQQAQQQPTQDQYGHEEDLNSHQNEEDDAEAEEEELDIKPNKYNGLTNSKQARTLTEQNVIKPVPLKE